MHQKVLGRIGNVRENPLARSLFARRNLPPETPGRMVRQKSEEGATRGAVHSTGSPSVPRQTIDVERGAPWENLR
jgi:hypothetical protein